MASEPMNTDTEIRDGIEWYELGEGRGSDCQCARCGSSVAFLHCWNCADGFVEKNVGDDVVEELEDFPCEYCKGIGGSWHCVSSPDWCAANRLPGRESIASTALKSEAWRDYD